MLSGTRVLITAQERSVSVLVGNESHEDCTVRKWVSDRHADSAVIAPLYCDACTFQSVSQIGAGAQGDENTG